MRRKFRHLCLKLSLLTTITSSLSFYPYQMDELVFPGYLLIRCSSQLPSQIKCHSLPTKTFSLLLLSFLALSLSASKVYVQYWRVLPKTVERFEFWFRSDNCNEHVFLARLKYLLKKFQKLIYFTFVYKHHKMHKWSSVYFDRRSLIY